METNELDRIVGLSIKQEEMTLGQLKEKSLLNKIVNADVERALKKLKEKAEK